MSSSKMERDLDAGECWRRLREHPYKLGRVAFVQDGVPSILPVNYRVDGESVVYRTRPGAKLAAVAHQAMFAFEADDVDVAWQSGWSVLLQGRSELVTARAEVERLQGLGLHPWAPGTREQWVRLRPTRISGRELL